MCDSHGGDGMSLDSTTTEQDLDATSQQHFQGLSSDNKNLEPDLAVDGLSESLISRFVRLITFRRS